MSGIFDELESGGRKVKAAYKGATKEQKEAVDVGAGATAGSFFGPWGALAGGVLGYVFYELSKE